MSFTISVVPDNEPTPPPPYTGDPYGGVFVTGEAIEDEVLTAESTLYDPDGMGTLHYQWQRSTESGFVDVGTDQATYTLGDADVGAMIRVVVSFLDGSSNFNSVTSVATSAVANVNDLVDITILPGDSDSLALTETDGSLTGGGTLTVRDADEADLFRCANFSPVRISGTYPGASPDMYEMLGLIHVPVNPLDADSSDTNNMAWSFDSRSEAFDFLGPGQTLVLTYTIGGFSSDGLTMDTEDVVVTITGTNDAPTGSVTISGVATSGNIITASHTIEDPEGLGPLHYQWHADGLAIDGAPDADSFLLTDAQVGKVISVVVSYTDLGGTLESVTGTLDAIPGKTIVGSTGRDALVGTVGDDFIDGNLGRDKMEGLAGDDTYFVDDVRDVVIEQLDAGVDTVNATSSYTLGANLENLTLRGTGSYFGSGNELDNVIVGNAANNTLNGFFGQDILTGGLGADTFTFAGRDTRANAPDVVTDFRAAQGDKLDLRGIDANEVKKADQAFTYIGTADFSGDATGLLRFDASSGMLLGSTDADLSPEVAIRLVGVDNVPAMNIVL